jgi:hypothetical protein
MHTIDNNTTLQFCPLRNNTFLLPKIVRGDDFRSIPLLIEEDEIDRMTRKLDLIDFRDLPIHYIEMIVAGCIMTVLKYPRNN